MKARARRKPGMAGSKGGTGAGIGEPTRGSGANDRRAGESTLAETSNKILELRPARPSAPVALPPTLGQFLQGRRDAAKKTVEEIAAETRIPERTLRKLESDESEGLPAEVFLRGYLRAIARVCGYPACESLDLFESARGESRALAEEVARQAEEASQKHVAVTSDRIGRLGRGLLGRRGATVATLSLLALGLLVLLLGRHHRATPVVAPAATNGAAAR